MALGIETNYLFAQTHVALDLLSEDRDFTNLGQSLRKVLSRKIEERPAAQMLAFVRFALFMWATKTY